MPVVHLDFETRSTVNLKDTGAYKYAWNPTTGIHCAAYAYCVDKDHDGVPKLLEESQLATPVSSELKALAANDQVLFAAHNAFFEQCIWRAIMVPVYGFPEIPIHRWYCTAAKAAAMNLPRSLKDAALKLGLSEQKDDAGHRIMQKLARPRKGWSGSEFWTPQTAPEDFKKLYEYCLQDVRTEMAVDRELPPLSPFEQRVWHLDQEINFRGVKVDMDAVTTILSFEKKAKQSLQEELEELTYPESITPSNAGRLRDYVNDMSPLNLPDFTKETVQMALQSDQIDDHIKRVLEIRGEYGQTSVSKFKAMAARVDGDDRLRELYLYQAALTGRWGGKGVQTQNLPRGTMSSDDIDRALDVILEKDYDWFKCCYNNPMSVFSSCVRGVLTASDNCRLLIADFSSVEAIGLAWLADQQNILDIFESGEDVYCFQASDTYGRDIAKADKTERAVGKVQVLALGYQGGINAFAMFVPTYGLNLLDVWDSLSGTVTEDERTKADTAVKMYYKRHPDEPLSYMEALTCDILKQRWRASNPHIVRFWYDVEEAAIHAVRTGEKVSVGRITFGMYDRWLLCQLPSGRCIAYPYPSLTEEETPWGDVKYKLYYWAESSMTKQWTKTSTYGGKLVENITQALCRDIQAETLVRWSDRGYNIVMHTHDEGIADQPHGKGSLEEFVSIMTEKPEWAKTLPIRGEGMEVFRYRK